MELITVAPTGCVIGELVLNNDATNSAWIIATVLLFNSQKIELMTCEKLFCYAKMSDHSLLLHYNKTFAYAYFTLAKNYVRQNNKYYV